MLSETDLAGAVVHKHFYGVSAHGIYNSKIVVCYLQTIHKTLVWLFIGACKAAVLAK